MEMLGSWTVASNAPKRLRHHEMEVSRQGGLESDEFEVIEVLQALLLKVY